MAETKVNQPKKVTDWKNLVKLYIPQKVCYLLWSSMANRKKNFTENWKNRSRVLPDKNNMPNHKDPKTHLLPMPFLFFWGDTHRQKLT